MPRERFKFIANYLTFDNIERDVHRGSLSQNNNNNKTKERVFN